MLLLAVKLLDSALIPGIVIRPEYRHLLANKLLAWWVGAGGSCFPWAASQAGRSVLTAPAAAKCFRCRVVQLLIDIEDCSNGKGCVCSAAAKAYSGGSSCTVLAGFSKPVRNPASVKLGVSETGWVDARWAGTAWLKLHTGGTLIFGCSTFVLQHTATQAFDMLEQLAGVHESPGRISTHHSEWACLLLGGLGKEGFDGFLTRARARLLRFGHHLAIHLCRMLTVCGMQNAVGKTASR